MSHRHIISVFSAVVDVGLCGGSPIPFDNKFGYVMYGQVFFCIGWDGEHVTKTKRKGALNKLIIFNVITCCAVKIYTYKI